jgi:hypothetical protein
MWSVSSRGVDRREAASCGSVRQAHVSAGDCVRWVAGRRQRADGGAGHVLMHARHAGLGAPGHSAAAGCAHPVRGYRRMAVWAGCQLGSPPAFYRSGRRIRYSGLGYAGRPVRPPLVDCSGHFERVKSQAPNPKLQRIPKSQIPTQLSNRPPGWEFDWELVWDLAVGNALELGIWSLGFDTRNHRNSPELPPPPNPEPRVPTP